MGKNLRIPHKLGSPSVIFFYQNRGEDRGGDYCTVMEAAKFMLYRLVWQGLLSCDLLSTPPAES
jgi:hypothetical protein